MNVWDGRGICLGLLHIRIVAIPGPGLRVEAVVLGLHKTSPCVVFYLGGSDEIKTVDGGGTAQNFSTRPVECTVSGIWLREGVVGPVISGPQKRM